MFRAIPAAALLLLTGIASAATSGEAVPRLPMRFETAPKGQFQYIARGQGYGIAIGNSTLIAAGDRAIKLTFEGSNPNATFQGLDRAAAPTNYFRGNERRSAEAYARVRRTGVYAGVDVVFYGNGQDLEYDFELAPGADPSRIAMRFEGADNIHLNDRGDVLLKMGDGEITQKLPVVYQRTQPHEIRSVAATYKLSDDGAIRLTLADYDTSKPLVIDPSIVLTGYFPGTGAEGVVGMARDRRGFVYLAGFTFSTDFALVGDAFSPFLRNNLREGWISKVDPSSTGNDLVVYSSFIGSSATDDPKALAVDPNGIVYLTGITDSFDYPTTSGAFVPTFAGGTRRIFLSVLDTTQGTSGLLYSTYFGGTKTDEPTGITVVNGLVYMTGYTTSDDFPVFGALQATRAGSYDAFLSVFNTTETGADSLDYSTYFGGGGQDIARSIAVGPDSSVYLAGGTYSGDFPVTVGAYRSFYSGVGDAFVTRIDRAANAVTYSTYLGGSDSEQARKLVLTPDGRVAVTGYTFSYNFPITQNAAQPVYAGNADVFLAILNPDATDASALVYSTFFGGTDGEVAYDMRRDAAGKYYLCGYTLSRDFPLRNPLQPNQGGGGADAFVAVLDPAAAPTSAITYSSYLTSPGTQIAYGLEVDASGVIAVTGVTTGVLFEPGQATPVIPSNTNVFLLFFTP